SSLADLKGSSKSFPKHETRHLSEHKNVARCAKFSPDGRFVATGSADTSIKLFEVSKIKQTLLPDAKDGPVRSVLKTYYDHTQPINDLDFHPQGTILVSGAKDQTIRFFDVSKANAKRSYRLIQDTHNVRSVSFHPSGDFLLAGIYFYHTYLLNNMLILSFSLQKWIQSPFFAFFCFIIVCNLHLCIFVPPFSIGLLSIRQYLEVLFKHTTVLFKQ
ncbi:Cleavage stimulation factor subunit 50, variant 3, partial [Lathyrus oleraceus]